MPKTLGGGGGGGGWESRLERALFTFRLKLPHLSVREPKGTPFIRSLCPVKPVHIKLERPRPPYDGLGPAPVNRTCGLDTYSWQVILMSSISSVINNLISARATQTHTDRDHALMKGIIRLISDGGSRFLSRLLEIVPSPFISTLQAEHVKASDKTHLKGDCLQQVRRRGDKTTRSSVRAHHPNTSTCKQQSRSRSMFGLVSPFLWCKRPRRHYYQCWGNLLLKVMRYNIALLSKKVNNYIT